MSRWGEETVLRRLRGEEDVAGDEGWIGGESEENLMQSSLGPPGLSDPLVKGLQL